jgi:multiple sugar transport system substrate-binding protein
VKQRTRLAVLLAVAAIAFAACGSTATTAPSATTATATTAPSESASTAPSASSSTSGEVVSVKWFCCLGTGDDPSQLKVEQKVVDDWNKAHPDIKLVFDHAAYNGARDALATEIASGNGPDIVGPVGLGGAEAFHGQWLDLAPLIEKTGYDLSQYGQDAVDFYKAGGEGQVGIPFAIYPSELYFQRDMFDEAGLKYPPQTYGEKYTMPDGSQVEWNYDTLKKVAMLLTVD